MRRQWRWRLGRLRRQQRRRLGRLRRQRRQRPGRLRRHLGLSSWRVATGMASARCLHGGIGRAGSAGGTTNIGRAGSAGQAPPAFSRCPHRGITSTGCGRAGGCGCVGADSCCFPRFSGRPGINASWTYCCKAESTPALRGGAPIATWVPPSCRCVGAPSMPSGPSTRGSLAVTGRSSPTKNYSQILLLQA